MIENKNLSHYVQNGFKNVNGFCPISCLEILDYLDKVSIKSGGALEIGVHHGQFFIALNQLISESFISYAVDVFENQHLNIDHSGEGDKHKFIQNLKLYDRHNGKNVRIIEDDSTDVNIFNGIGRFHYISIDGGHTVEHVLNDLFIAQRLVTQNGIVIVDDYFNHWWPSVTEGIFKYLSYKPILLPFATSENKLWLCKLSYHKKYVDYISNISTFNKTITKIMGNTVVDLWK
jgi:hypothetical protein